MITIGADPEFFIQDSRTGIPTPACGRFGGRKGKPVPIEGLGQGYGYQEDNVMLEFNVPPAQSWRSFFSSIEEAMTALRGMLRDTDRNLVVDSACARLFSREALEHPKAQEFGCSPDFNAYTSGSPFPPIERRTLVEDEGEWRFAGGHIHLGYNNKDVPPFVVAAFADVFIGLYAVEMDKQGKRRELYGLPGRFRPTPYGIEYRTLSNYWLFNGDERYSLARRAYLLGRLLENTPLGVLQGHYINIPWGDVQAAIREEDAELASNLIDEVNNMIGQEDEQ